MPSPQIPQLTYSALWHLAKENRHRWKTRYRHYATWVVLVGALIAAAIGLPSLDDPVWVVVAAVAGVVGGPTAVWAVTFGRAWSRPERRVRSILQNEKPGVPTTHGETRPNERQPIGDPWWQIVYPDGTEGEWFERARYAGLTVQPNRVGGFNFDFDRRGQGGHFVVRFRGRIKDDHPPVPLGEDRWHFTEKAGWNPSWQRCLGTPVRS